MCGGLSSLDRLAFARTRCPKDPKDASFMQGRGCNEIWLRASPSHPAPRFSLSGPSSAPHPDTAPPPPSPSPGNFPSIPKLEFPAQRKRRLQIKGMQHAGRCHGALQPQPPSPLSPASPAQATMVGVVTSASLVPGRSVRIPGPRLWLLGLAVLWLLTARLHAAPVASSRQELRCICLTITPGIHPKMTTTLEVIAPGPQCPNVQVIAILKNGKEVCLDPVAPLIKKIVQKILDSGKKKSD